MHVQVPDADVTRNSYKSNLQAHWSKRVTHSIATTTSCRSYSTRHHITGTAVTMVARCIAWVGAVGPRQPCTNTSAKAGLSDRETRNALDVGGLGGRRPWGISPESLLRRSGLGPAASRGRETRHRSLTSNGGQRQCALHDDDGCGVLARIH